MPSTTTTPYSTARILSTALPTWVPELEQERIASYDTYEDIYWNVPDSFKLVQRGRELKPLYIPKPMTIVDTTSYYYLKGLQITVPEVTGHDVVMKTLAPFLLREKFYSRFHVAKHSGVARGDFVLHLTADPNKQAGSRISLTSVDPRQFFPIYADDDVEKLEKVHLVEQFYSQDTQKVLLKKLTYEYVVVDGLRRVSRTEGIFEVQDWFDPNKAKMVQQLLNLELLPTAITRIPVYHFKNKEWQGEIYGRSELSGLERILAGINQSMADEELALALDGLGVYHTDAPRPTDDNGDEEDWEISPGKVLETPNGTIFKRVDGVGSVKPSQDHVAFLEGALHEASGTSDVAIGKIDVQTAQSGIALAIKFMPTLAKIEERDLAGTAMLANLFFDWRIMWLPAYEGINLPDLDIVPIIGEKLPTDRVATVTELNNLLDRNVISRQYYRQEMQKLGYEFPNDIEQQILDELKAIADASAVVVQTPTGDTGEDPSSTLPNNSKSNNAKSGKVNESKGTEANQDPRKQNSPPPAG